MSRRQMLSAGATTVAGGLALGASGTGALAQAAGVPESWDEEADVVIIGTGFAGLAAAYEVKKAGASVVLLEKMRVPGGNSIICGGLMAAAGMPGQEAEDSADKLYDDMMQAGLHLNHPPLVRIVSERSGDTAQWLVDAFGVEFQGQMHLGGHSVPRSMALAAGSGSGIVVPQLAKLKDMGVEPRTRTLLKNIVRDADGRVQGVVVHEGHDAREPDSGTPKTIRATRAVVLATGGFGNDLAFRQLQDPRLDADYDSTNQPGATAEALREALNIGATPVQPSWIQLGPWASPDERGFGIAPLFVVNATGANALWVHAETGKRFVNELADRKTRADAMIAAGNKTVAFIDQAGLDSIRDKPGVKVEALLERGVLSQFETLEEMAAAHGMPSAALNETVESYNAAVAAGEDPEFGRYIAEDQLPMGDGPYLRGTLGAEDPPHDGRYRHRRQGHCAGHPQRRADPGAVRRRRGDGRRAWCLAPGVLRDHRLPRFRADRRAERRGRGRLSDARQTPPLCPGAP